MRALVVAERRAARPIPRGGWRRVRLRRLQGHLGQVPGANVQDPARGAPWPSWSRPAPRSGTPSLRLVETGGELLRLVRCLQSARRSRRTTARYGRREGPGRRWSASATTECPHCAVANRPLHDLDHLCPSKAARCVQVLPLPGHAQVARNRRRLRPSSRRRRQYLADEPNLLFRPPGRAGRREPQGLRQAARLDGAQMLKEVYAGRSRRDREPSPGGDRRAGAGDTPPCSSTGRQHVLPMKAAVPQRSVETS